MEILHYISGPLIGAVIGYITNYIAIKMLFRPRRAVYVGKFRLPFTPGIVPRRKDELAGILGGAVVDQFFNSDDLEIIFTSDYLADAFAEGIADTLMSENSLKDMRADLVGELGGNILENIPGEDLLAQLKENLCVRILAAALNADFASIITDEVTGLVTANTQGALLKSLGDGLAGAIAAPLEHRIESYIINDARPVVMSMLDSEFEQLAGEPIKNVAEAVLPGKERLVKIIARLYAGFMKTHVRSIVSTIDIRSQIEGKVREMDPAEVESLVVSVVKKELKYVVWLGALLGLIIGTVNIFI
jgi:uncharacterized membrane protein YheB (UPF0754 family)